MEVLFLEIVKYKKYKAFFINVVNKQCPFRKTFRLTVLNRRCHWLESALSRTTLCIGKMQIS